MNIDITERKQAEQELIISEIAKRRLAERQMAILNACHLISACLTAPD
jgi:hypothetical protein